MKAKLVVVGGDAKTAEIDLKLPATVGRGREASLTLPHPLVSRLHCELYESDGRLFVRDLGSLNGTFVNNERIDGESELPEGDLLTIGTVTFRADFEEQAEMRPPEVAHKTGNDTERAPSATTVSVPASNAAEGHVITEGAASKQQNAEHEDDEFDGFDDLDFDEIDELGEDEEFHEQAQPNAAGAVVTTGTQQTPVGNSNQVPQAASLPAPTPPMQAAPVPPAKPVATPTASLPTPSPPTPSPPAQAQSLPSPEAAVARQVTGAKAIGPPDETQQKIAQKSDDDALGAFLKGLK